MKLNESYDNQLSYVKNLWREADGYHQVDGVSKDGVAIMLASTIGLILIVAIMVYIANLVAVLIF